MSSSLLAAIAIVSLLVLVSVLIHYEMLYRLSRWMPDTTTRHRYRVVVGVLGALLAHVIEVWLFAFGYYFMVNAGMFGTLQRNFSNTFADCLYFSLTTYTTLGIGDIEPIGEIRFLAGVEAVTGLVLITWTASFMFVQMQKFWDSE
jgi:hypothetical protein